MTEPRPGPPERFNAVFDYDDRVPADLLARWTSLDPDRVSWWTWPVSWPPPVRS